VPSPLRELVARLVDPRPQGRPTAPETRKLLQLIGEGKPLPAPPQERATLDMKKSEPAKRVSGKRPSRRYALIAGGTVVFVGSVLIAYFATRKSGDAKPAPTPAPVVVAPRVDAAAVAPTVDAEAAADDPWTYDPRESPIVKAWSDGQAQAAVQVVTIEVLVPRDYQLFVNGKRMTVSKFSRAPGERVAIVVWDRDHKNVFRMNSFLAGRDEVIDLTVHDMKDCNRRDMECMTAFCADHADDLRCSSD